MQQSEYDRSVTTTREKMGQQTFNARWTEGQAMTFEQAIDYALAEPEAEAIEVSTKNKFGGLTAREREKLRFWSHKANPTREMLWRNDRRCEDHRNRCAASQLRATNLI